MFKDNYVVQDDMSDYFKLKTSIKAESRGALRLKEEYGDHPFAPSDRRKDVSLLLSQPAHATGAYECTTAVEAGPGMERRRPYHSDDQQRPGGYESDLYQVMQWQNEITKMLVKQQDAFHLPKRDIHVFKGDPLVYKSFIRAFEHAIDSKTESSRDKLYYLEQYISGEPSPQL